MATQIYLNLPVADLQRTREFFTHLRFEFNPQFSGDTALCMVIGENIFAMLLLTDFFQTFTKKPVADATRCTEVLICLSCESRARVDELVARALAAGGKAPNAPQDHGNMYAHGFEDLDGHQWELAFMDATAATPG